MESGAIANLPNSTLEHRVQLNAITPRSGNPVTAFNRLYIFTLLVEALKRALLINEHCRRRQSPIGAHCRRLLVSPMTYRRHDASTSLLTAHYTTPPSRAARLPAPTAG